MTQQEVSGHPDLTLLEAIQSGVVSDPGLLGWNEWERWRVQEVDGGLRPTMLVDGVATDNRFESTLWRSTMEALHGSDWRMALADRDVPT